jgi:hypothetical protein
MNLITSLKRSLDAYPLRRNAIFTTLPSTKIFCPNRTLINSPSLSTNKGLCLFNPKTLETKKITREDGLQHNEFNKGTFAKTDKWSDVFWRSRRFDFV